jgi:hypothetical protein
MSWRAGVSPALRRLDLTQILLKLRGLPNGDFGKKRSLNQAVPACGCDRCGSISDIGTDDGLSRAGTSGLLVPGLFKLNGRAQKKPRYCEFLTMSVFVAHEQSDCANLRAPK